MALGQAAGAAAAMAVEKGVTPRELDGREVRKKIGFGEKLTDLTGIENVTMSKGIVQRNN